MGDAVDSSAETPSAQEDSPAAAPRSHAATPGSDAPMERPPDVVMKASADTTKPAVRPSGLKPPSKIGRLCAHTAPKPAVPISPRTADGSSTETLRKYSDDYSRKHLADLVEADEEFESSGAPADRAARCRRKASTSSTYSFTSMDALWEKHPRKLSEAGLRRSSDHSVVLTEDTDSFIIGERVWVGGSKPGQIAYIGETQFAPGEWAGIVLDDPIGKNDGSVAGTRYFQCAERRGVFSRLTRLTRAPLFSPRSPHAASPASDAGSVFTSSGATPTGAGARQRRTLSPNGSVRSAVSSKMNMSVTSTANGGGGELRLGERVIVSSSQGSKAGTLRYTGPTDFAAGLWCGVELDDPIGKNDGSVEGKRYFECAPRFGLFAPASKVSRSPSNRRPGACAIHNNGRSMRRSNSRESLTSLGTSIVSSVRTASRVGVRPGVTSLSSAQRTSGPRAASTPVSAKGALQELLREKQQHLERLMRERELERTEVAKVTLQVERVQAQLAHAVKQSSLAVSENETLKAELLRVNKQLEDERQRAEELLFRTEEDNIHKEDYNKFKQAAEEERGVAEKRIEDLEAEVALLAASAEASRAAYTAAGDKHAAELDTLAAHHREEIHAAHMLSGELQKLLDEAYALLKEKENEKDSLGKSMTEELSRARAEAEKALSEAKSKLSVAQTEFEAHMSVLNAKLQMAETKLETEKQNTERLIRDNSQTIAELNSKITHTQAALDDKTHELNKVTGSSKEQELTLTKEITKLKMELSAKVIDLEQLSESNKKYEVAGKVLESEIGNIKEDFTKKINEYESLLNETSQQNDRYSAEIAELQQKLITKTNELEKVVNESKDSSTATTKIVKEYKEIISERDKQIVKLKHDFEETTANFNKSHTIIAEEHKKLIEDRNLQIEKLTKEIEGHQQVIEKNKIDFHTLTQKVDSSIDEIKNLVNQNAELSATINELNKTVLDLNTNISAMELKNGELERQLNGSIEKCSELQKAKEKVETEYINLTSHSTNSNDEINKLSQYLRETEKELQDLRDKFREKSIDLERTEQEFTQHLTKCQQDVANEKESLNKTIIKIQDELAYSEGKVKELDDQVTVLKDQSSKHELSHLTLLNEKNVFEKEIEAMKSRELELQTQLQDINKKSYEIIEDFKHKIDILKADGETSEVKLKEKVDQLVEAQNDLNNRLEQAQENEEFLQKKLEEVIDQFNNEKSLLNKELNKKDLELSVIKEEISRSASEGAQVNSSLEEKDNIIKNLNLKLAMFEVDIKSNMDIIAEKERQVSVSAQELSKNLEDKQRLEQKLSSTLSEINTLQKKQDDIIAENNENEIIAKTQKEQIDKFIKDIDVLTKEKGLIEIKSQEALEKFAKISVQYQETLKEMENIQQTKTELSSITQEKDHLIKIETEKYLKVAANIQALQIEKDNLEKELTDKNMYIDEKEKQISKLRENTHIGNAESVAQIETLKKDVENMSKAHKGELENLHKTIKSLEINSKENESKLEKLIKKDEQIAELQNLLSKTEADIKQLTNINDGQKANYEDLNKQLQSQYEKLKKDSKKERHSLRESLQEAEKTLEESKTKIKSEITKQTNLQIKLAESEKRAQELADKVELLTVHQKNSSNVQDNLLEKLTLELQAVRKSCIETSSSHEQLVNKLKTDNENKINDLLKNNDRISKLEEELKNQKVKTEIAQREKYLIQQEWAAKEKENIRKENYDNGHSKGQGDENTLHQAEEREQVEGQVEFLNSVIVDMQRKNELLLARVQALETGFSPDAPAPNLFHYESKKEVAPRLFCDICDVFDAHDTEDCPRQAGDQQSSSPPPAAAAAAARKPPPPPRPYCDICEVFGHSTENCDEEETF